jgi:hypothetical protein
MSNCKVCGEKAERIQNTYPLGIATGYRCNNPECDNPQKEWTVSEDEYNQKWSIKYIKKLEKRIEALEKKDK